MRLRSGLFHCAGALSWRLRSTSTHSASGESLKRESMAASISCRRSSSFMPRAMFHTALSAPGRSWFSSRNAATSRSISARFCSASNCRLFLIDVQYASRTGVESGASATARFSRDTRRPDAAATRGRCRAGRTRLRSTGRGAARLPALRTPRSSSPRRAGSATGSRGRRL